jgi:hypothetical protein
MQYAGYEGQIPLAAATACMLLRKFSFSKLVFLYSQGQVPLFHSK